VQGSCEDGNEPSGIKNSLVQPLAASLEGSGFMELLSEIGRSLGNGKFYPTDQSTDLSMVKWGSRIFNYGTVHVMSDESYRSLTTVKRFT
jgi:hypothetical protein